jgi:hypothetical protein
MTAAFLLRVLQSEVLAMKGHNYFQIGGAFKGSREYLDGY